MEDPQQLLGIPEDSVIKFSEQFETDHHLHQVLEYWTYVEPETATWAIDNWCGPRAVQRRLIETRVVQIFRHGYSKPGMCSSSEMVIWSQGCADPQRWLFEARVVQILKDGYLKPELCRSSEMVIWNQCCADPQRWLFKIIVVQVTSAVLSRHCAELFAVLQLWWALRDGFWSGQILTL